MRISLYINNDFANSPMRNNKKNTFHLDKIKLKLNYNRLD